MTLSFHIKGAHIFSLDIKDVYVSYEFEQKCYFSPWLHISIWLQTRILCFLFLPFGHHIYFNAIATRRKWWRNSLSLCKSLCANELTSSLDLSLSLSFHKSLCANELTLSFIFAKFFFFTKQVNMVEHWEHKTVMVAKQSLALFGRATPPALGAVWSLFLPN